MTGGRNANLERPVRVSPSSELGDGRPGAPPVEMVARVASFAVLLEPSPEVQLERGYYHTLREVCQQPETWRRTAAAMVRRRDALKRWTNAFASNPSPQPILVTGSGSSLFGGECVSAALQDALRIPVRAVSGGDLLTDGAQYFWSDGPRGLISLARSGNSPESSAAIDLLLEKAPTCRHLIITCNQEGRLAARYVDDPRVLTIVLDEDTCDRGLVMTSSFTNMVVAGSFLGLLDAASSYTQLVDALASRANRILVQSTDDIARLARLDFRSAVFLGTGCRHGAAREAGLKMLEMTSGHVPTVAETYLGLRHGPMSAIHESTVVVCFLSSDLVIRSYESDLIRELNRKRLGLCKVIVGERVPDDLVLDGDLVVDYADHHAVREPDLTVLDVLVGQLLAFFRCLHMGLNPDQPSTNGAIARVVESFRIHRR